MKKLLFISLLLLVLSCSDSQTEDNPELNEFIAALDDKSLDEIKEEVNTNIEQFEAFTNFFEGSFSNDIEFIKEEDESYEPEFKIDTTGINNSLKQFKQVVFSQGYSDYQSTLNFSFSNTDQRRPLELGEGVSASFIPTKIYYHDGNVQTDSIANYEVDFSFDDNWGQAKPIDSVAITYKVNYLEDFDVVEVSADNPKVTYKGGEITLVKAEDNYVYLTFSDTIISPSKTQATNTKGKFLSRSGYSNNGIAPKDSKGVFTEMLKYFKKLQEKLNDDDFENTAEFQEYLRKNLSGIDYFNDQDGLFHREYYYNGNVNSIKLYFKNDSKNLEASFIATNAKPFKESNDLIAMETEGATIFLNSKGEPQITIKGSEGIENLGGNFYEDSNYFYHLNRTEKRLDTLLVFNIETFKNGLVGILTEQENQHYSLFTADYKPIGSKSYWLMEEVGELLIGITTDDQHYILDENANATMLPGVIKINDGIVDDRIMVYNADQKVGFINSKGKVVIPFKYDDAKDFEDGLTAVKYNGTYKIIDLNAKVVVDTEEDYINFFSKDDNGKRIYSFDFGAKVYNYKGELISEK